ncbi:MAG: tetratricopeptide repeat protein [Verrucomicrobia bacterium]|nr:tetratricopeptide repeat protein [Verrucomicrobiota bacterium]
MLTNWPQSALVGRAHLGRGWTFWEEATNSVGSALPAFAAAVAALPRSADQAVARFKLADSQFLVREFPAAVSNYWMVATNYVGVPGLTNSLFSQALYQVVRAGIETGDLEGASNALNRLATTESQGPLTERASLLLGQALTRRGNAEAARALFADFGARFTNSILLPEVRLAAAQTYEREQDWPRAIQSYSNWLAQYGPVTNLPPDLVARARFELARLTFRTAPGTNALTLLTDFVARHPTSPDAPLAKYLMAEQAYNEGDYARAELLFQDRLLSPNAAALSSGVAFHARLMAGRAAIALRSFRSAREHFDWVITNGPLSVANSPIPTNVAAEAYLLRGDTFILEDGEARTNTLERFGEAIVAFSKITEQFPNSDLAPAAWGRIGDCHFTLAAQDPKRFDRAAEAFRKVIESNAGVALRSQAEVKLATTLEKQAALKPPAEQAAQLDQALGHYLRVLYGQNLRPGELADPHWVKRAGLAAAELAEALKRVDTAIGLYQRLLTELPALRPRMERRIAELEKARTSGAGS